MWEQDCFSMYQYEDHKTDDVRDSDVHREQENGGPLAQMMS